MNRNSFLKSLAVILVLVMVVSVLPISALAAAIEYTPHDDYYKVISKDDYDLAPGIVESEIVLNNAAGSHRQVAHVVEVDLSNPYAKVIPSYKGMIPTPGNYGVQIMSEQAKWAEANGYGNVVAAMNLSLSWYDSAYYDQHPELVGEPLGYMVLDGNMYVNSNGMTSGAQTCVVINFDEKDGEARPADMPKVVIRSTSEPITGWEEQVIPANFGFLVKDGKNQYKVDNNAANGASRSFVGIKADGTFVMVMNDGRQAPFSSGFTNYEMAEFMLSLGCVAAVNGDGGGSSAFLSQRPGEELKINCSPSDGAERPTTHGILVISTAPATGEFARANITVENDYYTPGSTVKFSALGTDLVGTPADIPADATWQLADPSMGTIEDGVFVSNGKVGTATAQLVWNGEVVGSASVEIVVPTEFTFIQGVMTVPFDKEVNVGLKATINGGLIDVVLKPSDVVLTTTNDKLGTFDGFMFTSVSEENAPADLTSTLTATLVHDTTLVATASLSLGKGSEVLFDFEDASDIDAWNIADVNGNDKGFYQHLSYATAENGEVHDGVGSMRVEMNPIAAPGISNGGYAQSDLFLDNGVVVKNAKSIGFWAYIPDEYEHCWIRVLYWYDSNNDGKYDKKNTITVINQPEVYDKWDESGWKYFSVDVSAYSEILIPGLDCKDKIAYNATKNDANNFRFIEFMFPHTNTNALWQTYGTINGLQTVYVDNITADFSDAVDDREAPIFSKVELAGNDTGIALKKYETVTTASNLLTVTATVAEDTAKTNATGLNAASAKAYVDGVEVPVTFANGRMTISDVAVADGIHRVKFEICDNMGNKSVVIRLIKVASGVDASTVQLVPADPTLNNLYGGSIYWMNMNANKIETIQSVKAVIDLNYGNHFELDNMILADGFTAEYTIDVENNTATIVITRTGKNTQTGAATLAALPVRVIYFDTDIKVLGSGSDPDYTAETYWNTYEFWPYDVKVDVDMGEITYVDGYASDVLGAFSNEEFSVDTELQGAFSDPAFKAERGTAHVHTPVAVDDKAATCTEAGYIGRTFCEVCNSVVDWGTVVEATGHTYEIVDGKLVCDCGLIYEETGLIEINGKYGYLAGGSFVTGWLTIGNEWYYFDTTTCTAVKTYNNGYVTFEFEENGKLVSGQWFHSSRGSKYYYGPDYYSGSVNADKWVEIDGKNFCFDKNGYCHKGIRYADETYGTVYTWYDFGEDGAVRGKWEHTGLAYYNGNTYYVKNGISQHGMFLVNGDYYYFGSANHFAAVKNTKYNCTNNRALLPAGEYWFGFDGKMVDRNVYNIDDTLYYLEKGKVSVGNGSFSINGIEYPIDETGKVLFTGNLIDASGSNNSYKNGVVALKNGPVGEFFYENGVQVKKVGVVEYEGNYYYIGVGYKVAKDCEYYFTANLLKGTTLPVGRYAFDSEGKMILRNGPSGDYFYKNGVQIKKVGVIEYEGNYYYIGAGYKVAKDVEYYFTANLLEGTTLPVGRYAFDSEGKMILRNGPFGDYFYENGIQVKKVGVVEYEGNYYYIGVGYKIAKDAEYYFTANLLEGTTLPVGRYAFDSEGKMILRNGPSGDYFYKNGVQVKKVGVVEYEGNYYYIGVGYKVAKDCEYYFTANLLEGTNLPVGRYAFDSEGKMILN